MLMYFFVNTDYLQVQIYVHMFLEATSHLFLSGVITGCKYPSSLHNRKNTWISRIDKLNQLRNNLQFGLLQRQGIFSVVSSISNW